jgi:hypothetical protein
MVSKGKCILYLSMYDTHFFTMKNNFVDKMAEGYVHDTSRECWVKILQEYRKKRSLFVILRQNLNFFQPLKYNLLLRRFNPAEPVVEKSVIL